MGELRDAVDEATAAYYQDDLVTLYHGDCREVREWLAADVLVTDPPYGVAYRPQHKVQIVNGQRMNPVGTRVRNDLNTSVRDDILAAWGERPALVFGRWDVPRPAGTRVRLIWDKDAQPTGNVRMPWGAADEEIYVLGPWPPIQPGGRVREGGTPARHGSVIRVPAYRPGSRLRPNHPTPKPVELLARLLGKCPPGVVADPCAGSGSTLLAARWLGRRAIGVEVDERYCELIATRLSDQVVA